MFSDASDGGTSGQGMSTEAERDLFSGNPGCRFGREEADIPLKAGEEWAADRVASRARYLPAGPVGMRETRRDKTEQVEELLNRLVWQSQLEEKTLLR
jgi:hypothetical protein